MKLNLTILSTTTVMIVYLPALLVLIGIFTILPTSARYSSVFDNNAQIYLQTCPELAKVKSDSDSPQKLTQPFTLLNWNIYKQKNKNWAEELQELTRKADLLTLQEIKYSPEIISFSRINSLFYFQNSAFKYQGVVHGVNTLSKVEASYVCGTRYSEPWIIIPKTGLATIYPLDKQSASLLLINIHGVNFTFTSTPLREQIQPYLALIKSHTGPVIFSGDFNTWSSPRLEEVEQTLQKEGFQEALYASDQRSNMFGHPLDHIYYRGLEIMNSESWATQASDHTPQLVTFTVKQRAVATRSSQKTD